MRILVQLCQHGKVRVDGNVVSEISRGEVVLVGFTEGDDEKVLSFMVDKLLKLRIFADAEGKTNLSLQDVKGAILAVSQFTLYADVKNGNRPSFVRALGHLKSKPIYDRFVEILSSRYPQCAFGIFGADMKVELVNDGPFTILLDSEELMR